MTFEEIRVLIPEYLADQLGPAEKVVFEEYLRDSAELRTEVEELRTMWDGLGLLSEEQPSAALRVRFYERLNHLQRSKTAGRFVWWKPSLAVQLAGALALFVGGVFVGRLNMAGAGTAGEVAQLRTQVQDLHQTVALSLMERQSATSRLEGISWGSRVDRPDNELLSALVTTLNHDPNTNVRLASLDALEKFSGDESVRRALVGALNTQDSPLVQIALIDALVHVHDHAAAGPLRKLTTNVDVNAAVRQRAQWGLQKLTYQ